MSPAHGDCSAVLTAFDFLCLLWPDLSRPPRALAELTAGVSVPELDRGLTEPQIQVVCRQMLEALRFLHGKKIIHRDLKAGNVLMTLEGDIRLGKGGRGRGGGRAPRRRPGLCGQEGRVWAPRCQGQQEGTALLRRLWTPGTYRSRGSRVTVMLSPGDVCGCHTRGGTGHLVCSGGDAPHPGAHGRPSAPPDGERPCPQAHSGWGLVSPFAVASNGENSSESDRWRPGLRPSQRERGTSGTCVGPCLFMSILSLDFLNCVFYC